jgi:shikimate dehydrogenase
MPVVVPDIGHRLTSATRLTGVLGWPIGHSRSPALHNAVHAQLGIDAYYHLLPTPPDRLRATIRALDRLGWLGANVTIPHKIATLALCDTVTDEAELIGAVNVLHFAEGRIVGDNTDARGHADSLMATTSWRGGEQALVVGTGGAARAIVVGLAQRGAEITVAGRRSKVAAELADLAQKAGSRRTSIVDLGDPDLLRTAISGARIVVNATPVGMHGERLPAPLESLSADHIASELVYEPAMTPFLLAAQFAGAELHGGLGMLAHQAALGFGRWHGVAPPVGEFVAAAATISD